MTDTTTQPIEARCHRCKQTRPVFPYKPLHDCVDTAGLMNLIEAAEWIADIEIQGDRWCTARINREGPRLLCVPCTDRETADEEQHIKEYSL